MKNIFYKLICISEAQSEVAYQSTLERAGFIDFGVADKKSEVLKLLEDVCKKLLVAKIAQGLGKVNIDLDFTKIKNNLKMIEDCVHASALSYALMMASKVD